MASSSSTLCQAQVTYKKQPGQLSLTHSHLTFHSNPSQPPIVSVLNNRMTGEHFTHPQRAIRPLTRWRDFITHPSHRTVLFASKEGAAKVALKIALSPETPTSVGEESYNFQFTAGSSAVSDRERFKKELSTFIAKNRDTASSSNNMDLDVKPDLNQLAAATASALDKGKTKATQHTGAATNTTSAQSPATASGQARVPGTTPHSTNPAQATSDFHLRKLVLQAHPALMSLHRDLVMSRQISEQEFWAGREDLLDAVRAAEQQLKGKSGGMVDPKPETDNKGDVTVKITPQLIIDIFAEYPAVLRAYNDNVPNPVRHQCTRMARFEARFFQLTHTRVRSSMSNNFGLVTFNRNCSTATGQQIERPSIQSKMIPSLTSTSERRTTVSTREIASHLHAFVLTTTHPDSLGYTQMSSPRICNTMRFTDCWIWQQQRRTSTR